MHQQQQLGPWQLARGFHQHAQGHAGAHRALWLSGLSKTGMGNEQPRSWQQYAAAGLGSLADTTP
jgi:hypothetical protein